MKKRFISITLVLSMIMSLFVVMPSAASATEGDAKVNGGYDQVTNTWYVKDAQDLKDYVDESNNNNDPTFGHNIVLLDDIDVSGYDAQINIGSSDHKYYGTFDGRGHTIKGLTHIAETTNDAGLFAYTTNGAVIKNVVIDQANIKSARRGGILVGRAENTNFLNVSVRNSTIELYTLGAVIDLITFGGMCGGGLIGEMYDSVMYNCETVNTNVLINSTGGVQGVGGNNIFLGGLVGGAIAGEKGNIIEYSRVIKGKVENNFDVAVGAVSGQVLYSGGIAGYIQGEGNAQTAIVDCFSSGDVRADGQLWVSVAAGIDARCGGIVAGAWGKNILIERCHYAGNMSSYLLNNVLLIVLPITHENYYLYGILGPNDGVTTDTVKNCYYDYSKRLQRKWDTIVSDPDEGAIRDVADNVSWSGLTHEAFTTQSVWSDKGFDFAGTETRSTMSDEFLGKEGISHINRWIIDYNDEMPVHGKSVSVGIDFPNAGTAAIGAEGYREGLSTSQGYVTQITNTYDNTVTLTATANDGYNFEGWYAGQINSDGSVSITGDKLSGDMTYIAPTGDNAVYVAHYTANVIYTDISGNTINTIKHAYNEPLKFADADPITGQQFYGWTRDKSKSKTEATQNDISGTVFVSAGMPVTEPMTLYPVYIGVSANIHAVFESTGTDTLVVNAAENAQMNTVIASDDSGWYVTFKYGDNETAVPEGYMFDGWYRKKYTGEAGEGAVSLDDAICVSRDEKYYIDEDEILDQNLYIAKFKYKVTAWMPVKYNEITPKFYYCREGDAYKDDGKCAEIYVDYGQTLSEIKLGTPNIGQDGSFRYWSDDTSLKNKSGDGQWLRELNNQKFEESKAIEKPIELFAIVDIRGTSPAWNTAFVYYSDFPGSADIQFSYHDKTQINNDEAEFAVTMSQNYNFGGMSHYGYDDGEYTFHRSIENIGFNDATGTWTIVDENTFSSYYSEFVVLRASANVNFYDNLGKKHIGYDVTTGDGGRTKYNNPDGWDKTPTTTRKYQSLVFNSGNTLTQNESPLNRIQNPLIIEALYPIGIGESWTTQPVDNYKFLGWVDQNQLREVDRDYLYDYEEYMKSIGQSVDQTDEKVLIGYITSDSGKALGYTLRSDERVYAPMELYPLYAKYKINITTNIDEAELGDSTLDEPKYTVKQDGDITVEVPVKDGITVDSITMTDEDGNAITLTPGEDGKYTGTGVDVDKTYTIDIDYSYSITVKYHKGTNDIDSKSKNNGETLGEDVNTIVPSITGLTDMVFIGWTEPETAPESGYIVYDKETDTTDMFVTSDTVVNKSMDLYPVYVKVVHSSNIDADGDKKTLLEGSTLKAESVSGYSFGGWYASVNGGEDTTELAAMTQDYNLTKDKAVKFDEFIAVYKPIITYMIPEYDESGEITYSDDSIYTAAVDKGHKINNGTEGIDPSVDYQVETGLNNMYEVTGWSDTKDGNEYTGSVNEPITLYPILEKKENVYSVTFEYKTNNETGVVVTSSMAVNGVPEDTKFNFSSIPDPQQYVENGVTYYFSHWSIDGDTQEYKGDKEYTVTGDVTFTAVYAAESEPKQYTVYSNWNDNSSMEVSFVNGTFPNEDTLNELTKGTGDGITFIGYALVAIGENDSRTNDGLYAVGDTLPENIGDYTGEELNAGKRIYAVWAQIDTANGASVRLDDEGGMRVMGYVNTDILERVGLNTPDVDYKRGMDFSNTDGFDQNSPFINATSGQWYGNSYRTLFEDGSQFVNGFNAFSIIAQLTDAQYSMPLSFRAWLRFTYTDKSSDDTDRTKTAYGTFDKEANNRTLRVIASQYMNDLKTQNNNDEALESNNWYGLGKDAYDNLAKYANANTNAAE